MLNKSSRAIFAVMKNRVSFGHHFKTMINITYKLQKPGNCLKILVKNRTFCSYASNVLNKTNNGSANKFL